MEEIIKTANLKKVYGLDTPYPKTALNGVSISVNKGTFACIMGTSGSGKTTLIKTLSIALGCDFKRIQFTPDLLPSDIIGMNIFNQKFCDFIIV